jgi:hypothetical protein
MTRLHGYRRRSPQAVAQLILCLSLVAAALAVYESVVPAGRAGGRSLLAASDSGVVVAPVYTAGEKARARARG